MSSGTQDIASVAAGVRGEHMSPAMEHGTGLIAQPQRTELLVPQAQPAGLTAPAGGLDQRAILAAVRRRWFLALSLGILGGVTAAGIAFYVMPDVYTTFAEVRLVAQPQKLIFDERNSSSRQDFLTFRQTQAIVTKGPVVLMQAMHADGVSNALKGEEYPLEWLQENISVNFPANEFMRISLSGPDPGKITTILSAVYKEYLNVVQGKEKDDREARIAKLKAFRDSLGEELKRQRLSLKRLVETTGVADQEALNERQKAEVDYYAQLRKELTRLRFESMRLQTELAGLNSGDDGTNVPAIPVPKEVVDAELAKERRIVEAEAVVQKKQNLLIETTNATHPQHRNAVKARRDVEAAQKALETLRSELRPGLERRLAQAMASAAVAGRASLEQQRQVTDENIRVLSGQLNEEQTASKKTGMFSLELEATRKEIEHNEDLLKNIEDKIEKLEIEKESPMRVEEHRKPEVPNRPDMKKKFKIVGASGFGTLALIACGILWLDVRMRRINSLDEVVSGLRLPVLGSLPSVPRRASASGRNGSAAPWQGSLMESVDSARVMLLRRAHLEDAKVAMIVSAMSSEGKTTLSCHLATSLARAGYRTLLVDADIRRPTVHRVFELPSEPGLCAVLGGEAELAEAISPTSQEGLFVLPAGTLSPETLRELAQNGLGPIINALREQYDFIIVDSSPILPVTDSLIVSQCVDGVIFSIRRDVSQYPKVAAACQRLAMMGIPLWGAVVIGLDRVSYGYRYSYPHANTAAG